MEIIFVRHGKSEKREETLTDLSRHLTEKGKKKVQKSMNKLNKKLEPIGEREIKLWSSPADRALETAEIISSAIHKEINNVFDFIYGGSFEALQGEVKIMTNESTLFIIGHEPILSEWIEQITGDQLKMRKGQIINVQVNNDSLSDGKVEWIIDPK